MTEWSQSVWIAINLIIAAFIIMVVVFFTTIGHEINNEISRQEANRALMREYREYNGYNEKVVYAQDAVSAVLHYHGSIGIRVMEGSTESAFWCTDEHILDALSNSAGLSDLTGEDVNNWACTASGTDYTATAVQDKFDVERVYMSSLTYGANGEVLGITFVKGQVDTNGNFVAD